MIEVYDEVQVDTRSVACDGGNDSLGHPRVFLAIGPSGQVECPYCGRHFILRRTGDHPVVERAPEAVPESAGGSS